MEKIMKRLALIVGFVVSMSSACAMAADKRPMTIDDLFKFQRISEPQISPDGKTVAYVVGTVDLPGNKTASSIWLASTQDSKPHALTNTTKKDSHPRWSPDGQRILFESNRSGDNQLWVIDVNGGEAQQLTTISSEAGNALWSPDSKWVAFVSAVYPEYSDKPFAESDALNKKRKEETEKNPVKAKVFTKLFFRHWNEWVEDKRQHLFVLEVAPEAHGLRAVGLPRDVTPGDRDAFPTSDTFSSGDNFTFSPDSQFLLFTAVPKEHEAWSTNYDICRAPITGGTKEWECLTKDNPAADGAPQFSPDGKLLAYRAQTKPGFESDRWQLMVVSTDPSGAVQGKPRSWSSGSDLSVGEFVWGANSQTIYSTVEKLATTQIVSFGPDGEGPGVPFDDGTRAALSISKDGKKLAFTRSFLLVPPEVNLMVQDEKSVGAGSITGVNSELLMELQPQEAEAVWVDVQGAKMHMWIVKPPNFDPKKKWPLAFLVHGGPQGAWEDGWSYRWNPRLWAAQGYVVALPNPRGSTGFGQKFVDEISGDWGGKCFDDLMAGLAYLEKQPYVDRERMAAAGASFCGYMMNWFQGHTTKFKTLITHCGVYNFDSMYALTEELWFDEWEHGGPPWLNRDSYEKFSPHRFAKNFKTPMLIIHNDLDFRVPVAEGLQLFTTLQRLGVPSKMINFPDEGHWVLKPANSAHWHKEVFAWLAKYAPPGGR
jgi:dipeptidyl aminopeptidase/acylaminoacyl peptidase